MTEPEKITGPVEQSPASVCSALSDDEAQREGLLYSMGQVCIGINLARDEIAKGKMAKAAETLTAASTIARCCLEQMEAQNTSLSDGRKTT